MISANDFKGLNDNTKVNSGKNISKNLNITKIEGAVSLR